MTWSSIVAASSIRCRVRAALDDVAEGVELVVERTGTPAPGAVVGDDLLAGDRLVERRAPPPAPGRRRRSPARVAPSSSTGSCRSVGARRSVTGSSPTRRCPASTCASRRCPARRVAEDLGSTNGTTINGHALTGAVTLQAGDLIGVGDSELLVVADPPRGAHLRIHDGFVDTRVRPRRPAAGAHACAIELGPPPPAPGRATRFPGGGRPSASSRRPSASGSPTSRNEVGQLWQRSLEWVAWAREVWPSTATYRVARRRRGPSASGPVRPATPGS